MLKRRSRLVLPVALISLIAGSSLVLAACSSDDEESDRQASGGQTLAWEGQTGNTYGDYRGVEVDIVNTYRVKDRPMNVGIAAKGTRCPASPDSENPCRPYYVGTDPREVPANQFARWKAYDGEILFTSDANRLGKFRSSIKWIRPDGKLGVTDFQITNPAIGRPKVSFLGGTGCNLKPSLLKPAEGETSTAADESSRCQVKLDVTRLGDSKQFKRFRIKAR
jgi:hypothetical protein